MSDATLSGFTIGITADRRQAEQAHLFERRGARVVIGPTIRTLPLGADDGLRRVTESLIAEPPDYLVANTGIGMREWFAVSESWGLGDALVNALGHAHVVARGPKAGAVIHQMGLTVHDKASSERLDEVVAILRTAALDGKRIAFQRHGADTPSTLAPLVAEGATIVEVPVYRWLTPDDAQPAARLVDAVIARRVQAVTFTSAPAVHNFLAVSGDMDVTDALLDAFNGGVIAACVGPVCAQAATERGISAPLVPDRARLGPLVRTLADHLLAECTRAFVLAGVPVRLQGSIATVGRESVELAPREAGVLAALADAQGAVVTKRGLLADVWGDASADPHVVETTMGRLRAKLGAPGVGLVSVPRRGYRLAASE